jgi:tetratricopeptide (TPR) repeat protein
MFQGDITAFRRARLLLLFAAAVAWAPAARAQGFGGTVTDTLVRGDSLLTQRRPNEAIIQFQEARTLCPTPAESVHSLQGEAQARLALDELLPAAGLLEEAATTYPDDPRVPDLLYAAGSARYKAGDLDKSIELWRKALRKSPTPDLLPSVKFRLAQALRFRGGQGQQEVVEILKDFESSYPNSPLLPNALYTLAIAHHDLGKLQESETEYRALIERFPGRPAAIEAHFELAAVLVERGKRKEAADLYRRYVSLNPRSPEAAFALERAGDLTLLRDPKESFQLYAIASVKAKDNPPTDVPGLASSRWLPFKKGLAGALSRVWVLVVAGTLGAAGLALLAAWIVRRMRGRRIPVPPAVGAGS